VVGASDVDSTAGELVDLLAAQPSRVTGDFQSSRRPPQDVVGGTDVAASGEERVADLSVL
jgi:hypothetical protein